MTVVEFDKQQPAKTEGFTMYKIRTEVCISPKPPQQVTLSRSLQPLGAMQLQHQLCLIGYFSDLITYRALEVNFSLLWTMRFGEDTGTLSG